MRVLICGVIAASLVSAQTAATLLARAEALIQKERFADAIPVLNQAAKLEPANVEILYRLGYSLFRERRMAEAKAQFNTVCKTAPPAWFSRYFLGRIALLENHPQAAVTWLEPVVASKENVFDAPAQLAAAYAAAGQTRRAVPALKLAIAAAPWDSALYYRLGRLYQQLGEAGLAKEALGTAARLKSTNREDVQTLMAVSRSLLSGDPDGAIRVAKTIAGREDADPDALVALGVLYGNSNLNRPAVEVFGRAASRNPDLFQAQYNLGLALLRDNRAAEALGALERAVKLLPQSLEANLTYGLAGVMNQDYTAATAPLERAWTMDPDNPRVGTLLATALLRTGNAAKAVPLLRTVVRASPSDSAPLLLLVEALSASSDQDGALQAAETAKTQFPALPQAQMAFAQQLARVGRYQDAGPAFEQVLKLAPGYPEAELGLADSRQRAGEHESAIEHYRAALPAPSTALAARTGLARSLIAMRRLEEGRQILEEGISTWPESVNLRLELSRVLARLGRSEQAAEQTRIVNQLRSGGAK